MTSAFETTFGFPAAAVARAPGRVNVLGEHTDYNDGYVLPTAIPQTTTVAIAPSLDGTFHVHSAQLHARVSYADGEGPPAGFAQYVHGCIEVLRERGHAVPPLAVSIDSDVPIGAGLSSSAALEVATLRALRRLLGISLDDVRLAQLGQEAEIRFAHVNCGIMDQMASSLADPGHLLFLDTRTLERRRVPLPARSGLVVLDSGIPRELATSGYNDRRAECEAATRLLGVRALRDVTDPAMADRLPPPLDRRARHVITEDNRVLEAVRTTEAAAFGRLMNDSHASLRDHFEVSVPALDRLVALLQAHGKVHGARLTGAGFGGACVALVRAGAEDEVKREALAEYRRSGFTGSVLM